MKDPGVAPEEDGGSWASTLEYSQPSDAGMTDTKISRQPCQAFGLSVAGAAAFFFSPR